MEPLQMTSIAIGTGFILIGLVIVLVKGELGQQAFWVVRVLVSLGAGLAAAGVLGSISVEGTIANITIKAGGPIAFAVLVYAVNPPKMIRAIRGLT